MCLGCAAAAAGTALALAMTGCEGGGSAAPGTLRLVYGNDPDTLNPITASDNVSESFQRQVYEPLATRRFDNPDAWDNYLAESYDFDDETNTYTIRLRQGVYWHPLSLPSGKPLPRTEVTADDVLFTFDAILNEFVEAANLRSYYLDPEAEGDAKVKIEVEKIDRYTVKVRWRQPYFLSKEFTLGIAVVPRHVFSVDERGDPVTFDFRNSREFADLFNNHWANTKMCGTGPMRYVEWQRERRLVLVRNEDYWGKPYPFERLVFQHIANPNTIRKKALQNELDFASITEKQHWIQDQTHPAVVGGRVELVSYDYPGYRYMGYNLDRPFLRDKKVRWALSHAVPVQEIVDELFYGLAIRVNGPFPQGSSSCDPALPFVEFDLNRSRRLLDEAGWSDSDGNGVRDKIVGGERVEAAIDLMIFSSSPTYRNIGAIIKENFRKIQVRVEVTPTEWALMLQKLNKKEFDATILGWVMSWKQDPFQLWHGSEAEKPDSSNFVGYVNPRVDKLIEKLRVTIDEKEQAPLYQAIHREIFADQPYTFLFAEKATAAYDTRLTNIRFYKIRPCIDTTEWRLAETE